MTNPLPNASPGGLGASLFEASDDCVKLVGLDGALEGMNVNGLCLMEIDDFAAVRGQSWASLWPEAEQPKIAAAVAQAGRGQVARFSADCPTAKGALKSWEVVVSPVFGETGKPARLVSISRDVTHLNRVEAENALLVRELAHRIKNMFAVVDGVISLSARAAAREVQPFASALRDRLIGLGRAVSFVSPSAVATTGGAATQTLQELLQVLLAPYGAQDGASRRIALAGDDLVISGSVTTSLALLVNELATNALKYGALATPAGHVAVTVSRTGDNLELLWQEQGATPAPRAIGDGDGFGTILMDNAVRRQMGGVLQREWLPGGLHIRVTVPVSRMTP